MNPVLHHPLDIRGNNQTLDLSIVELPAATFGDCFGTLGTLGTYGGCAGTAGTYGCSDGAADIGNLG